MSLCRREHKKGIEGGHPREGLRLRLRLRLRIEEGLNVEDGYCSCSIDAEDGFAGCFNTKIAESCREVTPDMIDMVLSLLPFLSLLFLSFSSLSLLPSFLPYFHSFLLSFLSSSFSSFPFLPFPSLPFACQVNKGYITKISHLSCHSFHLCRSLIPGHQIILTCRTAQ